MLLWGLLKFCASSAIWDISGRLRWGLAYIQEQAPCGTVVVMDGDGEDKPEDVPRLLDALEKSETQVVFAERGKRLDGPVFRASYLFYRTMHRVLTGRKGPVRQLQVRCAFCSGPPPDRHA